MELNGVANLQILLDQLNTYNEKRNWHVQDQENYNDLATIINDMWSQIYYMENYLKEIDKVLKTKDLTIPYWHEIIQKHKRK